MLQALFGNPTIEKILLFLLVNEKCYATQLHRLLMTPLTPLQKGLERLEKGGIVTSYYEGKTRIYHMNEGYPLLKELESFLKRAYTLLPSQEKKLYYYIKPSHSGGRKDHQHLLLRVWSQLQEITCMTFISRCRSETVSGWNGNGKGDVMASYDGNATILFHEEGTWHNEKGQDFRFSNAFRWTLNRLEGMLSLEHLRYGVNRPVFLFHLAPTDASTLQSLHSHLCGEDTYFGHLQCLKEAIHLNWRIIGPKKNEEIEYIYQTR